MSARLRTTAASVVLAAICLVGSTGIAGAQSPPTVGPGVAVSSTNPAPGEDVTVSGSGFAPNSMATIVLGEKLLRQVVTNAQGAFTETVEIPCGFPPGPTTLSVRGVDPTGAPRVVNSAMNVADAECPGAAGAGARSAGGSLARTGGNSTVPVTAIGVAAVLLGALGVVVARRRLGADGV
jgi:LPXTG-motif cell wall-anchored protein